MLVAASESLGCVAVSQACCPVPFLSGSFSFVLLITLTSSDRGALPHSPVNPVWYSNLLQAGPMTWEGYSIWIVQFSCSFVFLLAWVSPKGKGYCPLCTDFYQGRPNHLDELAWWARIPFPCSFLKSGNKGLPSEEGFSPTRKSKQPFISPGHFSSCCSSVILQPTQLSPRARLGRPPLTHHSPALVLTPDQRPQGGFHFGLFPKHQELFICGANNFSLALWVPLFWSSPVAGLLLGGFGWTPPQTPLRKLSHSGLPKGSSSRTRVAGGNPSFTLIASLSMLSPCVFF